MHDATEFRWRLDFQNLENSPLSRLQEGGCSRFPIVSTTLGEHRRGNQNVSGDLPQHAKQTAAGECDERAAVGGYSAHAVRISSSPSISSGG